MATTISPMVTRWRKVRLAKTLFMRMAPAHCRSVSQIGGKGQKPEGE
jgi:hypothetical protein